MTQEDFDKASLLEQVLYDTTGMLSENHPAIVEAMEKYHEAKMKQMKLSDFNIGDCITNGVFDAVLETKPVLKADIIWLHNEVYEDNVEINGFVLKK